MIIIHIIIIMIIILSSHEAGEGVEDLRDEHEHGGVELRRPRVCAAPAVTSGGYKYIGGYKWRLYDRYK